MERRFTAPAPDRLWVADVSYLPTAEGWLYLATILDCFSRSIVGWSMASHLRTELVVDALDMATSRRRPAPEPRPPPPTPSRAIGLLLGTAAPGYLIFIVIVVAFSPTVSRPLTFITQACGWGVPRVRRHALVPPDVLALRPAGPPRAPTFPR